MTEIEIAEAFACPKCGGINYVVWDPKESKRTIACIHHGEEASVDQPSFDQDGNPTIVTLTYNKGFHFEVVRTKGLRGVERQREEGKTWAEKKSVTIGKAEA